MIRSVNEIESEVETSTITIPCRDEVESVTYENQDGGKVEISPLSMSIDMKSGLDWMTKIQV